MTTYYYALTDENDVLCVDQIVLDDHSLHEDEVVAKIADWYPDTIYFAIEKAEPEYAEPEYEDLSQQHPDEVDDTYWPGTGELVSDDSYIDYLNRS